jgi:protease-4
MTATSDMILDRRKSRRQLTLWRVLAIVAIVIAIIALIPKTGGTRGDHIARISIDGIIFSEAKREKTIMALAEDDSVKALIVRVDSPGGTVTASEAIYEAIRKVAAEKPVISVMGEYAASGGYMAAIAGEHIVARGSTLTGSIGVVAEIPNVEGLMEMVGVEVTRIKSAPLKAEPSFVESPSPAALRAQEELIADMFGWFRDLVAARRALSGADLAEVTDGRAFTGRQALALGLVDVLGDEETALDWLAETHELDRDLPVLNHTWRDPKKPWPLSFLEDAEAAFSLEGRLHTGMPRIYALIQ